MIRVVELLELEPSAQAALETGILYLRTAIIAFTLILGPATAPAEQLLPVEAFARLPDLIQVQLSPDAKNVAALVRLQTNDKSVIVLRVLNLESLQATDLASAADEYPITWIRWANNRYLLASIRFPANRFGIPTTETRLFSTDIVARQNRSVFSKRFFRKVDFIPQYQDDIVDMLPSDENNILMAMNLSSPTTSEILQVDITTGKTKRVQRGKTHIVDWTTDRQHRVRIALRLEDTEYRVLHKAIDGKRWKTLWEFEVFSEERVIPIGFDNDPNYLYVRSYHDGRLAVFKVDLRDPNLDKELVFDDPDYDVGGGLIYSKLTGDVIGIRYSTDGGLTFWADEYKDLMDDVNDALPDTANILYSLSDDERRYVVLATSDTTPGTYYVGDRDKHELVRVGSRNAILDESNLSASEAISYEARDGLEIEGVLTLPQDDGPHPAIIFPHGGPISFDDGGFDYWTQYFASRGYAVLQMNFRGSAGYGYDFMKSGLKSWGLEMQNDVEDGTRWLIDEGIADPEHICVVGASYGGYAALMEAARNPDLYNCAVSFAGVTDVAYLVTSHRRYSNYQVVKEQIGSDISELRERSPLFLSEEIEIPVLLVHGSEDRRVRVRHSRKMNRALQKDGKAVTYIELEDGDHHLSIEQHRVTFFKAMDAFLQAHL